MSVIKFLIGILGAVVVAVPAWLIMYALFENIEWFHYAIAGIVAFVGFSIAERIYSHMKKKSEADKE